MRKTLVCMRKGLHPYCTTRALQYHWGKVPMGQVTDQEACHPARRIILVMYVVLHAIFQVFESHKDAIPVVACSVVVAAGKGGSEARKHGSTPAGPKARQPRLAGSKVLAPLDTGCKDRPHVPITFGLVLRKRGPLRIFFSRRPALRDERVHGHWRVA